MRIHRPGTAIITALALATSIATTGAGWAQTSTNLLLDWAFESSHAVYTPAVKHGYFGEEGLDVTIERGAGSGDTVNKVATGTYEFGVASLNSVIPFNAQNPDNRVVAVFVVYDGILNSVIGLKSRGIETLKDIEGKKLVTAANHDGYLLFESFAEKAGIDASKVEWEIAAPNVRDALVVQGQVDGMLGISTARFALEEFGIAEDDISVFHYGEYLPDLINRAVIVSERTIEEKPELVEAFVRVVARSVKAAIADPDQAVEDLKLFDPLINTALERRRFEENLAHQLLTANVRENGLSHITPERLRSNYAEVLSSLDLAQAGDAEAVYTDRFLPDRALLRVEPTN